MHARICNIIVRILQSRYSVETVEANFCAHTGIQESLFDKLCADHASDPNWLPAKWDANPLRPYILVGQAIYDDNSPLSFPKKLSTFLLARLAADEQAISAFVDGIFPPPPVSAVTTAADPALPSAAAPQEIPAAGGSSLPPLPPLPVCCLQCKLVLGPDFFCHSCASIVMRDIQQAAHAQQQYNYAAGLAIANFLTLFPVQSYF
jgi:hypothetical protein